MARADSPFQHPEGRITILNPYPFKKTIVKFRKTLEKHDLLTSREPSAAFLEPSAAPGAPLGAL